VTTTTESGDVRHPAAAVALGGELQGELAAAVQDTHRAAAGRVFGLVGGRGRPVRVVHDAVTTLA